MNWQDAFYFVACFLGTAAVLIVLMSLKMW